MSNVSEALGIEYVKITKDEVIARLEVKSMHLQPMQLLHGGITAALAEEVMSMGSGRNVEAGHSIVGINLQCDHCGSARLGDTVVAVAVPRHRGKRTQVWHTTITDVDTGRLVSLCKMTAMNIPPKVSKL